MKQAFQQFILVCLSIAVLFLAGCGGAQRDQNHIKVGIDAGLGYKVAEVAGRVAKEKYGLDVKLV